MFTKFTSQIEILKKIINDNKSRLSALEGKFRNLIDSQSFQFSPTIREKINSLNQQISIIRDTFLQNNGSNSKRKFEFYQKKLTKYRTFIN
jgi:hypothetical protein